MKPAGPTVGVMTSVGLLQAGAPGAPQGGVEEADGVGEGDGVGEVRGLGELDGVAVGAGSGVGVGEGEAPGQGTENDASAEPRRLSTALMG